MVEVNDDKALVTLQRADNREKAKRARRLRAAERAAGYAPETQPGVLHMDAAADVRGVMSLTTAAAPSAPGELQVGTTQPVPPPAPPRDPAAAMRLVRFSVAGAIVVVLFVLWLRQRRR